MAKSKKAEIQRVANMLDGVAQVLDALSVPGHLQEHCGIEEVEHILAGTCFTVGQAAEVVRRLDR